MRLTLRTLLAYLDGILDPNDAEDIGKKIEESEFASGLVHRIRDVMRRMRLGAPGLTDRSPRLDPNTVAEYLDNTLSSEAVTDFEKVCLDSDVHLAEVASSHQILTLVLGEMAEIDPASRQRMYQLNDAPTGAEPPALPSRKTPPATPLVSTVTTLDLGGDDGEQGDRKGRPRPTVPEYLRESRRRRRRLPAAVITLLAVCFAVCFIVVVLMALGQLERGTPVGDTLAQMWRGVEEGASDEGIAAKDAVPPQITIAEPARVSVNEPMAEPAKPTLKEPAAVPTKQPTTESDNEPAKPATVDIVIKPEKPSEPKPAPESTAPPGAATTVEAAKQPVLEPASPPALLPPEPLGRLMSSDQVLLKDDGSGSWVRVAANEVLMPQRLLALPTYSPKATLTIGITLELRGGTQIELLPSTPQQWPGIRILFGRVVMMPLAKAGASLRVAFGDRSGVITFLDAESAAALEVRRIHAPGANPAADPPHIVAKLYATTGGIAWDETGGGQSGKILQLAASQWVSFNAGLTSAPAASKELPLWIAGESLSKLEARASSSIAEALSSDRLARLGLLELNTSRPQKEVKWLALRCLGYLGQYRDMVAALNDPDPVHRLSWPEYIDELRAAVARDSQSAAAIQLALEKQYPEQAVELYRMLWGYSDKDLQGREGEKLVRALDDETLAVRVLSSWNLKDLTGLGLFYRPEQTAAKRQQPTLRWRQRLAAGEIRLKTPEEKAGAAAAEGVAPPAPEPTQ